MHREMIPHVNHLMSQAGDAMWTSVTGWNPIPWSETDADWPMPPGWPGMHVGHVQAKSANSVAVNQQVAAQLQDPAILRQVSIDRLGQYVEGTIHGWMHNRWSAEPTVDQWSLSPDNDYLGAPFSSHVNKHFWKLHGWIDERIGDWERANDASADLSDAWSGPPAHGMHALTEGPSGRARAVSIPFVVNRAAVDELLSLRGD
jgi:hypothetical protein